MKKLPLTAVAIASFITAVISSPASALPGDSPSAVSAWIAAHPTLGPSGGDTLLIKKTDTAARRFIFRASTSIAGEIGTSSSVIRSEEMNFFDMINGVTPQRLSESLRVVYGATVYDDYRQSDVVCAYPSRDAIDASVSQNLQLARAIRGQVRQGKNFGYWLEVIPTDTGIAYNGSITLFLLEDLDKVTGRLGDCG